MRVRGQIIDTRRTTTNNLNMRRNRNFLDSKKDPSYNTSLSKKYSRKELSEHRQNLEDKVDRTRRLNTKIGLIFIILVILFSYWSYIILLSITSG